MKIYQKHKRGSYTFVARKGYKCVSEFKTFEEFFAWLENLPTGFKDPKIKLPNNTYLNFRAKSVNELVEIFNKFNK